MAIKNVVFDMGNVLLYWNPIVACRRYARDEELAQKLCTAIFRHPDWCGKVDIGYLTEAEYFEQVIDRLDMPAERALVMEFYKDYTHDSTFPIPESEKLVEELLSAGYRLYLLSNASVRIYEYAYKIPHFDRFSGHIISAEEKLVKPDPRIYRLMEKRYGLLPEETIFVDDLPQNVAGAVNVGWQGFLYDTRDAEGLRRVLGLSSGANR